MLFCHRLWLVTVAMWRSKLVRPSEDFDELVARAALEPALDIRA